MTTLSLRHNLAWALDPPPLHSLMEAQLTLLVKYAIHTCSSVYKSKSSLVSVPRGPPPKIIDEHHRLKCSECSKTFAKYYDLREHYFTHTGEKVRCRGCGIQFKNNKGFYAHKPNCTAPPGTIVAEVISPCDGQGMHSKPY